MVKTMADSTLIAHRDTQKITREELSGYLAPASTATHQVIPHHEVINQLEETLNFRHISIFKSEFAISEDGNKMFGLLELDQTFDGARFALGLRNSHDKTMRLAMTVGYRVFVCDNMSFHGDFQPVLAKHSKNFNLLNALEIGVGQMQRNFQPMQQAVETWRNYQITDTHAKLCIYKAFVEGELDAPKHLAKATHDLYFNPQHEEFQPRTMWALSNAFTSGLKLLDPIPQFKATGKLAGFLQTV